MVRSSSRRQSPSPSCQKGKEAHHATTCHRKKSRRLPQGFLPHFWDKVDGRLSAKKKIRERYLEIKRDSNANSIQKDQLCQRAAFVSVQIETMECIAAEGGDIERSAEALNGKVVAWYGGQEHATPGYEKKELDRLLHDTPRDKFDGVIVAYADRWSRDNSKSREGLKVFKDHGIRFFVGTSEYDLFNPEHRLMLGMSAEFGEFQASQQKKKSLLSRIERAEKGWPACGKLPFGRTFDDQTKKWGIIKAKQKMMRDVAKRYLAGESLGNLAKEYGVNHTSLHKTLMHRCGTEWIQGFHSNELNIHKEVPTTIPALLPPATIRACLQRAERNKTFERGKDKHKYLLGRVVYCDHCGYSMSSQTNHNGSRYYRHRSGIECAKQGNKAWVNADDLEAVVFRHLFDCFGNPKATGRQWRMPFRTARNWRSNANGRNAF